MTNTDDACRFCGGFANVKHLAGIPVVAIFNDGNININDIPIFKPLFTWYAVANLMVYAGADGFWKSVVIERCWYSILSFGDIFVTDLINFLGRITLFYVRFYYAQNFTSQMASDPHFFNFFRCFYMNAHNISSLSGCIFINQSDLIDCCIGEFMV